MAPWHWVVERGLDAGSDPRQGSARNDSDGGGTVSTTANSKTASISKLGTTFIPIVVYLAVCLLIFLFLRPRCKRVYAPRTIPSLRHPELPSPALPSGWFNWIRDFYKVSDIFVLNHGSLDGFFFLRYLKVLRNICFAGCIIIWPVLFPLHITGGKGNQGLESLTIGNVADEQKLYAHVFVSWLFFGFVIYTIVRECVYYVNLRQAYLSSPYYANRLSSRTILVTNIPREYLDTARLRKLYGDCVRRVFITRTSKALANLVKEREQTAERLEKAELELIKRANAARLKHFRKTATSSDDAPRSSSGSHDAVTTVSDVIEDGQKENKPTEQTKETQPRGGHLTVDLPGAHIHIGNGLAKFGINPGSSQIALGDEGNADGSKDEEDTDYLHPYGLMHTLPDVRGSVAAQWIPVQDRPHHRPIANYGRRVDTIRWTRTRLKQLNLQIYKMRREVRRNESYMLSTAFIEFDTQENAQAAQQTLAHHRPLQMSDRILGIRPDEVTWSALRMPWWERIIRRFAILTVVAVMVIFWALPSAFIGFISNISNLTKKVPFLAWLNLLPKVIVRFLESFIPPLALTLLMALVPIILRILAAQAGVPSQTRAELFTQNAYFAFQVVQVFLITTLTAAASQVLTQILSDPLAAKDILAKSIPAASNFYLSYILIQCIASGGLIIVQPFSLIRHYILSKISDLPRARYNAWRTLRAPRWGGIFPVYTNMAVIALSYSFIAPLVLAFAAGGMAFLHAVWKYNLLYIADSKMDSKGLFYPQALLHLIIGLYLAQLCMIGLFALNSSFAQVGLMAVFLVFTILVHTSLSGAIAPLLINLPQTLTLEEEIREDDKVAAARAEAADERADEAGVAGAASTYYDVEQAFGNGQDDLDQDEEHEQESDDGDDHVITGQRGIEGTGGVKMAVTDWLKSKMKTKAQTEADNSGLTRILDKFSAWTSKGDKDHPPSFLAKWLHPEEYEDFIALREMIPPDSMPNIEYPENYKNCNYMPPEMWMPKPILWIPKDEARVSRQEVAHTRKYTSITDKGATLNDKGRVVVDMDNSPLGGMNLLL